MATVTLTRGTTLPDSSGKTDFHNLIDTATGSVSGIVAADISGSAGITGAQLSATAAIADTQLATITTASKVNTSALTTTSKAAGDILYNDGTNWIRLAKDAGKYLKSGASAVSWDNPTYVAAGMVVQVVNDSTGAADSTATAMPVDDTIPQITEGKEWLTLAITPSSATNNLKITVSFNIGASTSANCAVALFQDATAGALAVGYIYLSSADTHGQVNFTHFMAAGTTSATTFRVRGGNSTGTQYLNSYSGGRLMGGVASSSITIEEIET